MSSTNTGDGEFVKQGDPPPHRCIKPDGKYNLGTVWKCNCGKFWVYRAGRDMWSTVGWYECYDADGNDFPPAPLGVRFRHWLRNF